MVSSDITPEERFISRRNLLAGGLGFAAVQSLSFLAGGSLAGEAFGDTLADPAALTFKKNAAYSVTESPNSYRDITTYNNYYEFGTDKSDPAQNAQRLRTRPWTLTVGGEAEVTGSFDLDDLLRTTPLEERIYRLRCVEAWSMVVPWVGFPLAALLQRGSSRHPRPSMSSSRPCTTPSRCRDSAAECSNGRTWRACASTRPCIR